MKVIYKSVLAEVEETIERAARDRLIIKRIELSQPEFDVFLKELQQLTLNGHVYDGARILGSITFHGVDIVMVTK